ncbi:MAG TPA: hypothetical protein VGL14_09880 [Methylomirabilota bacterium]|jgi:hypothetical protein
MKQLRFMTRAKRLTAIVLALIAAAVAVPAVSANDHGLHALGSFRTMYGGADQRVFFVAKDKGLPMSDRGTIHYRNVTDNFSYKAKLLCVSPVPATPNAARFGYVIPNQKGVPPAIVGLWVIWEVQDNGSAAPPDQAGYVFGSAPPGAQGAQQCDTITSPMQPITSGNIVVRQAAGDDDDDDDSEGQDFDD